MASRSSACRNGHPRTPENTYVDPRGRANCRPCGRAAMERYRRKVGARPRGYVQELVLDALRRFPNGLLPRELRAKTGYRTTPDGLKSAIYHLRRRGHPIETVRLSATLVRYVLRGEAAGA